MEKYFETLDELVKDENNIVTVPSYALKAHIPYEKSSEVIKKYFELNKGSDNFYPTFVLTGLRKTDGKIAVVQVNENTINKEKELFKEINSQSVFSIQNGRNINYNVIALVEPVDNIEVDISGLGAVLGKNCIKRPLRKTVLPTPPPATLKGKCTSSSKTSFFKTKPSTEEIIPEEVSNKSFAESAPPKTSQGVIANLFNKVAQNKKPEAKPKPTDQKAKLNGGLSCFLSKSSIKTSSSEEVLNTVKEEKVDILPTDKSEKECKDGNNKKPELFDSDTDEEVTEQQKSKPKSAHESNQSNQTKNKSTKKNSNTKAGNDKSEKKRKRIIVEESDSDDIFGSENSDEEIIESTFCEQKRSPKKVHPLQPKNKRRKAVTKTYQDDEGFIVTQTEYVYETASEDENEPQNKVAKKEVAKAPLEKKASKNSENDISPNKAVKGKKGGKKAAATANQTTLMNFFKKK